MSSRQGRFGFKLSPPSSPRLLLEIFKNKELARRALVTLGVLVGLYCASQIVMPGIDEPKLRGVSGFFSFYEILDIFAKGPQSFSIFALGIVPYLSSCLFLQLVSIFVPKVRDWLFGGERGRRRLLPWTLILTVLLSLSQSWGLAHSLLMQGFSSMEGFNFYASVISTSTAGTLLLVFLTTIINQYGLGNGIAMIVLHYGIWNFLAALLDLWGSPSPFLFIFALLVFFVYLVFRITSHKREISLISQKGSEIVLPFRPTLVGWEPMYWGSCVILIPATILQFYPKNIFWKTTEAWLYGGWVQGIILVILAFFLVPLYACIVFDSRRLTALLSKFGFVLKEPHNTNTAKFLDREKTKILMFAFVLFILVIDPINLYKDFYPRLSWYDLLILVGILVALLDQIAFYVAKAKSGIQNWTLCYQALDEMEATVKVAYLKDEGIEALVEPIRYIWGVPVRTVIDHYPIYVPREKAEQARNLLTNRGGAEESR